MPGLPQLLDEAEPLEDGFAVAIAEDWLQGRTAYGGLTSAIALAAARCVDQDLPPLRSGQFAMVAPLAGRVEARSRVLRRGRNATWISVELSGASGVGFTASFVFMRRIESVVALDHYTMPRDLIPVSEARAVPTERSPAFLRTHFESRFALPKAAPGEADLCWWVRAKAREGLHPEVECVLVGDALPTAVLPLLDFAVPISSMHWHVNMMDPTPSADGWWLIRSTSPYCAQGAASEHIGQWNSEGSAAMMGLQSVAVFG
ncbi:thioesterase family protein [Novosphingobium panipatense]|uniref:Thioesterase-like superfamily protein n=1 Tax=Novosphingobium panipatense TaxID=428991 RepID=A0ABY1QLL1_9SPHN|nr:thioesterase family protein [Novosphingobium panipatense]SMP74861.1 Thioesterase-like superfamily protein [Novosphingobium panipatense]